jgi:folate-binding protein YgfZ
MRLTVARFPRGLLEAGAVRPKTQHATEGVAAELAALRSGAGVTPLHERALLVVHGEDRTSFLQGMLSNDISGCRPGQGVYALLLTEQGRVLADLRAFALEREIWLDVPCDALDATRAALERYIVADDVELERGSAQGLALRGPEARSVLAAAIGERSEVVDQMLECGHRWASVAGGTALVARVRDVGLDGFHVWLSEDSDESASLGALERAGASSVSPDAVEMWRVSAGWAKQGVDFDERTLAPEVPSLARAISYAKGCYLGQEVVERVAARGHVNWLVVGLGFGGNDSSVAPGAMVHHGGREVGSVSSVALLPTGATMALARIRRSAADDGTVVTVGGEAGAEARVISIPVES